MADISSKTKPENNSDNIPQESRDARLLAGDIKHDMASLLTSIDQEFGQTILKRNDPPHYSDPNPSEPLPQKSTPQTNKRQTDRRRNPLAMDQSAEEITLANIETYLRQWHQLTEMLYEHFNTKTVVILTSAIADFSEEILNRDRFLLQKHNDIVFPSIERHGGKIVRSSGNTVLGTFNDPIAASRCALDLQIEINDYNCSKRIELKTRPIRVRIGVTMGQVMMDGEQLYGDAVRQAAILQHQLEREEIFISGTVYEAIKNVKGFTCEFFKKVKLRGRRRTMDIYELFWPKIEYDENLPEENEYEHLWAEDVNSPLFGSWVILAAIQTLILILYLLLT
ncbi:MAG: adenylate/guanylate cyclase domain-containing protein [Candidatus Magnetomorum sp.]|nr:adenylate/guanylate cyclase domain-containing protein [Candidatus Magnetomorum sp.]